MKVAVLTSGGHAPGMNAAVRAVAQAAFYRDWEVFQVSGGFAGLIGADIQPVDRVRLGGIMGRGGTLLGTERSEEFETPEGQRRALEQLERAEIEGVVVIGGGGSMIGAKTLNELGVSAVGVPATIDNDIPGTDLALGVDTALNTAVEIIDRIKDTAYSFNRAHVVEVLGRDCGYLAAMAAIAGGAEAALVPEFETRPEDVLRRLERSYEQGKPHFIVVASEGAQLSARELCDYINDQEGAYGADLTDLEHIQSGGGPNAFDRTLAGRLGAAAVEALADGASGTMVGLQGPGIERTPLDRVAGEKRPLDAELYRLSEVLAAMPAS
jgi:6-phosphofructokinase 1